MLASFKHENINNQVPVVSPLLCNNSPNLLRGGSSRTVPECSESTQKVPNRCIGFSAFQHDWGLFWSAIVWRGSDMILMVLGTKATQDQGIRGWSHDGLQPFMYIISGSCRPVCFVFERARAPGHVLLGEEHPKWGNCSFLIRAFEGHQGNESGLIHYM